MDNRELAARFDAIIDALQGIETASAVLVERQVDEAERVNDSKGYIISQRPAARLATGWPWTPNTVTQGFLAGRWLRRDGDVYSGAARRGLPGPNSPIRGGDDSQAKVSVPSGAPRS